MKNINFKKLVNLTGGALIAMSGMAYGNEEHDFSLPYHLKPYLALESIEGETRHSDILLYSKSAEMIQVESIEIEEGAFDYHGSNCTETAAETLCYLEISYTPIDDELFDRGLALVGIEGKKYPVELFGLNLSGASCDVYFEEYDEYDEEMEELDEAIEDEEELFDEEAAGRYSEHDEEYLDGVDLDFVEDEFTAFLCEHDIRNVHELAHFVEEELFADHEEDFMEEDELAEMPELDEETAEEVPVVGSADRFTLAIMLALLMIQSLRSLKTAYSERALRAKRYRFRS